MIKMIVRRRIYGAFLSRYKKVPKRKRPKEPTAPLGTPPCGTRHEDRKSKSDKLFHDGVLLGFRIAN